MPILMLTAKSSQQDRIHGLEIGADSCGGPVSVPTRQGWSRWLRRVEPGGTVLALSWHEDEFSLRRRALEHLVGAARVG